MSKPLENYIIRIKSSIDQFDNEGVIREEDRDHIELMTRGSFTKKNGSYYISYKETQTIGFEGCTTTIKIAEDGSRVALLRFGRANSQLLIERDRRNLCHYETEVGSLTLGVTGDGIGVNYDKSDLKYGLWETIESRTFPGSVSNHHLGTMLGLLMAAYEMNQFKDEYQKAVVENAKHFAKCLKAEGLDVAGDPAIGYTETHQVIVSVGYAAGPEVAARLERNNIIANYQATPDEEGFTASGALRMGVNEMTRFGFGKKEFETLASLIADCVLRGKEVGDEVVKLRSGYTQMHYCFQDDQTLAALEKLAANTGI